MAKEKQGFEKSLKRLEEIVQKLEKGDIELDESIELYQEGITLAQFCSKKLEEAKGKIEMVLKQADGKLEKQDFDMSSVGKGESNGPARNEEELF